MLNIFIVATPKANNKYIQRNITSILSPTSMPRIQLLNQIWRKENTPSDTFWGVINIQISESSTDMLNLNIWVWDLGVCISNKCPILKYSGV